VARRFAAVVEPLVAAAATAGGRSPVVFGEMVASLWRAGRHAAAIELEELWNRLAEKYDFRLLCAYPMPLVAEGPGDAARTICAAHTHAIPTESFMRLGTERQRLDAICELQQRAQALELEIRARESATGKLARRERELADLFDNAPLAIHSVGPDGDILWANRAELQLLGYSAGEYIGRNIAQFYVHPGEAVRILQRLRHGETLNEQPAEMRCKDGTTRRVLVTSNVSWDADAFVRTRCFSRDVTAQWHAEQTLRRTRDDAARTEALLSAIVQSSSDAIISRTLDGIILSWNEGAATVFGYTAEEAIGRPMSLIIPPERQTEERRILEQLARGERIDHFETVRLAKGGREVSVSVSISPIRDPGGAIVGASTVARDITELKRLEEHLRAMDRHKDEFIAMLGHELRNPLAPIRNGVELLRRTVGSDGSGAQVCQMLERQVAQMTRLLDDLLDVSRISRGEINFRREAVDVCNAARRAVEASRPIIDERRHDLQVELPEHAIIVDGDEARLVQMITNLLNNAAKYTPPGGRIVLRLQERGDAVEIVVQDDGNGIDEATLPRIFDLFVRGRSAQQGQDGLGVGLTLVRHIAEHHGGSATAHSDGAGRGSTFTVTLRSQRAKLVPSAARSRPSVSAAARRIVIVDDNRDAAQSLASMLRLGGHEVSAVHDAATGIDRVLALRPDVALLDIGLPDMDGHQVARRLRAQNCNAILVAITGYGAPEDHARSRAAGFDHHLVNPVDPVTLERLVAEIAAPDAES
jgi:PAS domain S-box-containing protein